MRHVRARIVAPKAPTKVGCGEWVSTGEGSALPRKKSILDLRRILVQTGCFFYSSPKAGLDTVLVRHRPKCQTAYAHE